jgi:hypothetical protein
MTRILSGVLLSAALLLSQTPTGVDPMSFLLTESKEQVARALGSPSMVADFGEDFQSWQYQTPDGDHDEFSQMVVFRKSSRSIVSVTRNYEPERNVDALFPETETTVHYFNALYGLRLRRLSGGRMLMAMGAPKRGQLTGQLVLMRESELRYFYSWLKVGEPEPDRAAAPAPAR